jgi:AraC family transcriptional regulator
MPISGPRARNPRNSKSAPSALDKGLFIDGVRGTAPPYHFVRQFKAAIGLSPHQSFIARRVERAKHLLQGGKDLSLVEVAAHAGFSDQSQLSRHFERLPGATPG